jgi:hypothetical protein
LNEWVTKLDNWQWALDYIEALYHEKQYRWGGGHATWENYARFLPREPACWERGSSPQYQAMDEDSKKADAVIAYRQYYITTKGGVDGWMKWEKCRDPPEWLVRERPYYGLQTDPVIPADD